MTILRERLGSTGATAPGSRLGETAAVLAYLTSAISWAAAAAALVFPRWVYGGTASDLVDQATAQDAVGLIVVAPILAALTRAARQRSEVALRLWPGVCLFAAYNAVIYAFAVDFGPLFLAWVSVLGLSVYAVLFALPTLRSMEPTTPLRWTGPLLLTVAGMFAGVWLGQVIGDLAAGGVSRSAAELGLPTNPVHVLDLALLIPAVCVVGIRSLRATRPAWEAPSVLVVLLLMCLPILSTPLVQAAHHAAVDASVVPPFAVLAVVLGLTLLRTLGVGVRR